MSSYGKTLDLLSEHFIQAHNPSMSKRCCDPRLTMEIDMLNSRIFWTHEESLQETAVKLKFSFHLKQGLSLLVV